MNILVTMPEGYDRDTFIPKSAIEKIEALGNVRWNDLGRQFTSEELSNRLADVDVCITGWGTANFDEAVLSGAPRLKLLAHTGGTVAPVVSDALYNRGVCVLSGNRIYAESVAEGVVAYALAALRELPYHNQNVHDGQWRSAKYYTEGLLEQTVGIVGLGMISNALIRLLKPFRTKIKVFSRHITDTEAEELGVRRACLEELVATCKIISLNCALTPETYHIISKSLLEKIPDGALLINTARGAVIDERALITELKKNRFKAVIDVFEKEPLPPDSELCGLENAILMPHVAGPTVDRRKVVTLSLLEDIESFFNNEPLRHEITREYAALMTR